MQKSELIENQIRQIAGDNQQLIEELLGNAMHVKLDEGQFAFRTGGQCQAYLIVLKGSVRVQLISAGGREVTLYRVGPGDTCVLTTSCLLSGNDYPAEAVAESNVEACGITRAAFESALAAHPDFRNHVFDKFSDRLKNVIVRVEDLVFESVDARLARALMKLHDDDRQEVTHQELAVELGTAREVVSRHLKQYEDRGLVTLGRGRVIVTNPEELGGIANPVGL